MQSTSRIVEHIHRGVIALNNAAVSLMERNCHCQSAAVLEDALAVLRSLHTAGATLDVYNGMSSLLDHVSQNAKCLAKEACSQGSESTFIAVQVLSDRLTETNITTACKMCQEIVTQTTQTEERGS
jgi:hypothetical protein